MRFFINDIFRFSLYFILIILLPLWGISNFDNLDKNTSVDHNIISLQTKSLYKDLEILFIGNSYCYSSINTNILDSLNIKSFNLGIATSGVDFYDMLIDDYYNKCKTPPKKVLLLISPMTFSDLSDNFISYPIHRYLENEKSNLQVCIKYNRLDNLFSFYKRSIKKFLIHIFEYKKIITTNKIRSNNKGYYPSINIIDSNVIHSEEHLYRSLKMNHFDHNKINRLIKLSKKIEKNGSEVILFELPTNILYKYFNNEYLLEYNKSLKELSAKYKLITIDENLFKSNHYRNIDHMNSYGANIATFEILKQLKMSK